MTGRLLLAAALGFSVMPWQVRAQEIRQSAEGNCIVQNVQANSNTTTLHCYLGGAGELPADTARTVEVGTTVENLAPNAQRLDIIVENRSPDSIVSVNPVWLTVLDDAGNTYGIDRIEMMQREGAGLFRDMLIPPGRSVRLPILLDRALLPEAREVFFVLDGVTAARRGSPFPWPLGALEWSLPLAAGEDEAEIEATVADVQRELARIGYYTMKIDGVWGNGSRAALERFQRRIGEPATGEQANGLRLLPRLRAAAPDPAVVNPLDCIIQPRGPVMLMRDPDMFGTNLMQVPAGEYYVQDRRQVTFVGSTQWWFRIRVGNEVGWVENLPGFLFVTGDGCFR